MKTPTTLPTLAITLGDPAGVGTEVALRAVVKPTRARCRAVLIGDLETTFDRARILGLASRLRSVTLEDVQAGRLPARAIPVLPAGFDRPLRPLSARQRLPGRPSRAGARVAYESIVTAVQLAQSGAVDSICTAPISKEWFSRAGVAETGHTEILGELSGVSDVRMMMAVDDLRVVLATIHVALRDVAARLDTRGIRDSIVMTADHLRRWWGVRRPRIAVAALNPHASDGGVYGDEESTRIAPAIRAARRAGVDASGPYPADTLFSELGPSADAVVAMYHDQGLVPIKQRDVHRAVNVTLGLPFVRTSPDHGTAYDLAGTGRADPRSMRSALELALRLAPRHGQAAASARQSRGRPARRDAP